MNFVIFTFLVLVQHASPNCHWMASGQTNKMASPEPYHQSPTCRLLCSLRGKEILIIYFLKSKPQKQVLHCTGPKNSFSDYIIVFSVLGIKTCSWFIMCFIRNQWVELYGNFS